MSAPMPEGTEPTLEVPEVPEFNLDVTFEEPTTAIAEPVVQETGVNPAWDTLKEKLPKEFHSQIDPILSEWDKNVQQKFQQNAEELRRYEAWKEFVDNNVDPNQLRVAHQMAQNLNTDPLTFYNNLSTMLRERGLIQEAQQVEQKAEEELEALEQVNDPRIDALAKQQEMLIQGLTAQQQAQMQADADARIAQQVQSDMAALESKTGPLPEWVKNEVFNRGALMTQQLGRPVGLQEAFMEFQKIRQQLLNTPRPGETAPRVVPGGGGFPARKPDKEALKTFEGRGAAIAEIIQRQNG